MGEARYDDVLDFYVEGFSDALNDPITLALIGMAGAIEGRSVLDAACGHGRVSRELARRGAVVRGVDISRALIGAALDLESSDPLGIVCEVADMSSRDWLDGRTYDLVTCNFGLSDIDDLDGALEAISRSLKTSGSFVFSILHPCFAGGPGVSGSWPTTATYYDEVWWRADDATSSLRRQVGANHRTPSTYLNGLRRHGLVFSEVEEPQPTGWPEERQETARGPVSLGALPNTPCAADA